ncbi:MAG: effector-associated constant component EACC1 [Egibacteraceae bacterium]
MEGRDVLVTVVGFPDASDVLRSLWNWLRRGDQLRGRAHFVQPRPSTARWEPCPKR